MSGTRLRGFLLLSVLLLPVFSLQANVVVTEDTYSQLLLRSDELDCAELLISQLKEKIQKMEAELRIWQIWEDGLQKKEVELSEKASELLRKENELNKRERQLQAIEEFWREKEESQDDSE